MNLKIVFSLIATFIAAAAFLPYFKDTLSLKTKPHAYTWLIWALTQGTATIGIWYGGGGWGGLNLTVGLLFIIAVFFFSLKYGTKNITKSDSLVLMAALCAILVWWQLDKPLISMLMVSAIDVLGYIPSIRKSYHEPWSETLISWFAFALSDIFALLALNEYNFLTATYLVTITIANLSLFSLCLFRRRFVPQSKPAT